MLFVGKRRGGPRQVKLCALMIRAYIELLSLGL
jgi:hypothetical protein